MIYLFHGNDASGAKQKIQKLTDALLKKKPDALHFYFDDRSLDNEFLKSLFQSSGLFAEHHIVFLDRTFTLLESKDLVKDMKKSAHVFILFEDGLDAKDLNYIKKHSQKDEEFVEKKSIKKEPRKNIFALTDAIASRDKKKAWVLYRELVGEGMSADEIQPMFFWQVKSMLQASNAKNATESGLKPFVFDKAKRGAERYGKDRLNELSRSVVDALYMSRRGGNLENRLEQILLSL